MLSSYPWTMDRPPIFKSNIDPEKLADAINAINNTTNSDVFNVDQLAEDRKQELSDEWSVLQAKFCNEMDYKLSKEYTSAGKLFKSRDILKRSFNNIPIDLSREQVPDYPAKSEEMSVYFRDFVARYSEPPPKEVLEDVASQMKIAPSSVLRRYYRVRKKPKRK